MYFQPFSQQTSLRRANIRDNFRISSAPGWITKTLHFSILNEFKEVFELIFSPVGIKIRFVREFAEIPPNTIAEAGLCLLGMNRSCSGMS